MAKRVTNIDDITDPYTHRILSNVLGRDSLRVFKRTRRQLKKLVKGLSRKQLRFRPAPGKWSIAQVVAHLADAEITGAFRLRMMLSQSGSPIQAYDQDKWAAALKYENADAASCVKLFSAVRRSQVALLESLNKEEWEKFGMHEERGKETVERLLHMYAGHDMNHLTQIESIRKSFRKKKQK